MHSAVFPPMPSRLLLQHKPQPATRVADSSLLWHFSFLQPKKRRHGAGGKRSRAAAAVASEVSVLALLQLNIHTHTFVGSNSRQGSRQSHHIQPSEHVPAFHARLASLLNDSASLYVPNGLPPLNSPTCCAAALDNRRERRTSSSTTPWQQQTLTWTTTRTAQQQQQQLPQLVLQQPRTPTLQCTQTCRCSQVH